MAVVTVDTAVCAPAWSAIVRPVSPSDVRSTSPIVPATTPLVPLLLTNTEKPWLVPATSRRATFDSREISPRTSWNSAFSVAREPVVVDTSGGSVENVRIVLKRGTPVVLEPRGVEVWQNLVHLAREGVPFWSGAFRSSNPIRLRLVPGAYTITVADDTAVRKTSTFIVADAALNVPVTP